MKKMFVYILAVIMLLSVISACGKTGQDGSVGDKTDMHEEVKSPDNSEKQEHDDKNTQQNEPDSNGDKQEQPAQPIEVIYPEASTSSVGLGSTYYGDCYVGTYICKDYETDLTVPGTTDLSKTEEMYIYKRGSVVGKDALRQRCEAFLEYTGIDIEACKPTETTDEVYQVHVPSGKVLKVTGTIMDSFTGSAMVIRSMGTGITVGYISDTVTKPADLEFVKQYIKEDPIIAAACAYSGITEPELLYRRDYNIYGEQYGYYYICNAGDDAYTIAKRAIYLSFGDDNGVTLGINDQSYFKQDSAGALKTKSDVIGAFCAENEIDPDSILKTGFSYIRKENPIYVPCYLILIPGDNEFSKISGVDLSVYQEYDLIAIPAIEIS